MPIPEISLLKLLPSSLSQLSSEVILLKSFLLTNQVHILFEDLFKDGSSLLN